jgi:hypothetical protein
VILPILIRLVKQKSLSAVDRSCENSGRGVAFDDGEEKPMDLGFPAFVPLTVLTLFALAVVMLGTLRRLMALEANMATIKLIGKKLDLLMQHTGVKFDPFANVAPEIVEALQRGQKIQAIKLYRQDMGTSLKEAKDFIEELQQRAGLA